MAVDVDTLIICETAMQQGASMILGLQRLLLEHKPLKGPMSRESSMQATTIKTPPGGQFLSARKCLDRVRLHAGFQSCTGFS